MRGPKHLSPLHKVVTDKRVVKLAGFLSASDPPSSKAIRVAQALIRQTQTTPVEPAAIGELAAETLNKMTELRNQAAIPASHLMAAISGLLEIADRAGAFSAEEAIGRAEQHGFIRSTDGRYQPRQITEPRRHRTPPGQRPKWLVDELALQSFGRPITEPLLAAMPVDTSDTFEADRAAANIPKTDTNGDVVSFHALRVTFVSLVDRTGASEKTTQQAARHVPGSALTFGRYAKAQVEELSGVAEAVGQFVRAG